MQNIRRTAVLEGIVRLFFKITSQVVVFGRRGLLRHSLSPGAFYPLNQSIHKSREKEKK